MDGDVAAEESVIADADMAAEHHVVGERHVVADRAIVSDMRSHHEEAAIADPGDAAAVFGSGIHGDGFAQVAARADDEPGRAAAIMHRLRRRAERGERIDDGALADRGHAGNVNMGEQPHAALQLDIAAR